jgi:hypothetical protein
MYTFYTCGLVVKGKGKGLLQQVEVTQGVPGRLRPPAFLEVRHYEGGRLSVVILTHRLPLPQEKSLVFIFRSGFDSRAHGPVGSYGKKSLVTPP